MSLCLQRSVSYSARVTEARSSPIGPIKTHHRGCLTTLNLNPGTTGYETVRGGWSKRSRSTSVPARFNGEGALGRRGDELVGGPLRDVGGIRRGQSEDDVP